MFDQASYDNLRKIASLVDGQKNAARKVLYTIIEKNIKDKIKVSQLNSKMAEFAEYLHGSADNVIVNLAQDYAGTNNIPLLQKKGNFGTRFAQEASASRYIYVYGSKDFFELFNKEDNSILINQYFEGNKIEPKFYVPNLPILLINGSEGVSSGFAQKILPRDPEKIKLFIKNKLQGKSSRYKFEPYYKGFKGTVEQGETPNQWKFKGVINRLGANRIEITEVPVNYDLKGYIKVLDDLDDKGIITSYKDKSENDNFLFEVRIPSKILGSLSDEQLLDKLKLIKTVSENYTCTDEYNKIKVLESPEEIIDSYYNIKLEFTQKRKDYILNELNHKISIAESKYNYITAVIEDKIILKNKTKLQILAQIKSLNNIIELDGSYNYLINMPMHSVSKDTLNQLLDDVKKFNQEYKELESKSVEQIWLDEL